MADNQDSGVSFITGLIVGVIVGVAIGVLYAPTLEKETGKLLMEKAEKA